MELKAPSPEMADNTNLGGEADISQGKLIYSKSCMKFNKVQSPAPGMT